MIDTYDPTRHHIGLGPSSDDLKGFITVGPHSKQSASPVFEKPSNIGTEDLIGSRSHSVWTQNDYTGGEFQEDWNDPAMFSECVMMLPNPLGRSLRTTRPMFAARLGDAVASTKPVLLDVQDGYIYVVFNNALPRGRVYRISPADTGVLETENVDTAYLPSGKLITAASWNQSSTRLWLGSNQPRVHSYAWDDTLTAGNRLVHKQDYGIPTTGDPVTKVSGIHIFGKLKFITTSSGGGVYDDNHLWLYVSGTGNNAKWTDIGILPGAYITSVTYNNAVYFLTSSGNSQTQLSMSQGDQIFPVLTFPYAFRGAAMCEYAGRLYISGVGYDLEGNVNHGELYEVTGTSLRLVRTWAGEVTMRDPFPTEIANDGHPGAASSMRPAPPAPIPVHGGPVPVPPVRPVNRYRTMTQMADLVVADGLLWMPDSSWTGLEAYDATTDAFYGGARSRDGADSTIDFTNLIAFGSSVWAWGRCADDTKQGLYRTEQYNDDSDIYYPFISTSDFSPEPSRLKLWSRFTALTRGDGTVSLLYSTDSGQNWQLLDPDTTETYGYRTELSWDLTSIPASRFIRFRLQWAMPGLFGEIAGELIAHSVSFLVRGEDKKKWMFTVNASVNVADLQNAGAEQTPGDLISYLWALKGSTDPIAYRDVDGQDYLVIVADVSENHPAIDVDGEAYLPVTLIEV